MHLYLGKSKAFQGRGAQVIHLHVQAEQEQPKPAIVTVFGNAPSISKKVSIQVEHTPNHKQGPRMIILPTHLLPSIFMLRQGETRFVWFVSQTRNDLPHASPL